MFTRKMERQIKKKMFSGKSILLLGARQVGKTTLIKNLLKEYKENLILSFNCDDPSDRDKLFNQDLETLKLYVDNYKIIFIDEAQKVKNIGQTVKLLVDYYQEKKQIILTGSSSINLLENTEETLTGRKFTYVLYPISIEEIKSAKNLIEIEKNLEFYLRFGQYPNVLSATSLEDKIQIIKELSTNYLYKDILEFQNIKSSQTINDLLRALAFQVGSEVSYTELSRLIGIDKNTIEKYIDILEKNFIILRLPPFYKNKRREISKLRKIYFYDLGIRNALIENFNSIDKRDDIGKLWENFVVIERLKYRKYNNKDANQYFFRTYDGLEVDLVEEKEGKLFGYEIKWSARNSRSRPSKFLEYKNSSIEEINSSNFMKFLM